MRIPSLVLLAVLITGCAVKKSVRQGGIAESNGDSWTAAQHYLDALERKPRHDDANLGIGRVGEQALTQAISSAEADESSEDYRGAMEWYDRALTYTGRMRTTGHLNFTVSVDLEDRRDEMQAAAAFEAYSEGEDALAQRRWEDALAGFEESMRIAPNFKDASLRVAEVHYTWGEADVAGTLYRQAAGRFMQATQSDFGPFQDAEDRAIELYTALGRHHLDRGACRQAVRDLRIAHGVYPQAIASDLQSAEDCAFTAVYIEPIRSGEVRDGEDAGEWVRDWVQDHFEEASSEFTYLLQDGRTRTNHRTITVRGEIEEPIINDSGHQTENQVHRGTKLRDCAEGERSPCVEEVPIQWTENTSSYSERYNAWFQIIDDETRRDLATIRPTGSYSSSLRWASNFRGGSNQRVNVAVGASEGVYGVGVGLMSLSESASSYPRPKERLAQALEPVAQRVLERVIELADVDTPAPDPQHLDIDALK